MMDMDDILFAARKVNSPLAHTDIVLPQLSEEEIRMILDGERPLERFRYNPRSRTGNSLDDSAAENLSGKQVIDLYIHEGLFFFGPKCFVDQTEAYLIFNEKTGHFERRDDPLNFLHRFFKIPQNCSDVSKTPLAYTTAANYGGVHVRKLSHFS
jgi:hypothetical protein